MIIETMDGKWVVVLRTKIDRAFSAMRNRRRKRHLQVVRDSQETIESLRKQLQEKE